jgi:hypothetical protein
LVLLSLSLFIAASCGGETSVIGVRSTVNGSSGDAVGGGGGGGATSAYECDPVLGDPDAPMEIQPVAVTLRLIDGVPTQWVEPLQDGSTLALLFDSTFRPMVQVGVRVTNALGCHLVLYVSISEPLCMNAAYLLPNLSPDETGWGGASLGAPDNALSWGAMLGVCDSGVNLVGRKLAAQFEIVEYVGATIRRRANKTVNLVPYCPASLKAVQPNDAVYERCLDLCSDESMPDAVCDDASGP